ncbi:Protein MIZU-KUSSEI 1 [Hibiscus syriacus]|uniref:Protein MIZU-KUSSEI 1 n=1 Tax=Hibiscus syriacus TaxID=106335 RepID=A0A6A3CUS7_HIBSY|nr:protein MIZU-KUSSEI 1-like [Hibiscus syriacus]KAE8730901.1 Protein MIZU-KUSSEI 1 [Hibiscus syriacus]
MAKTSQDTCKIHSFHWTNKVGTEDDGDDVEQGSTLKHPYSNPNDQQDKNQAESLKPKAHVGVPTPRKKKLQAVAIARLRAVLTSFGKNRLNLPFGTGGLGPRVVGTLFGARRGHVHFAFQKQPDSAPAFLVELATPISALVREMASGLVRIALECDKKEDEDEKKATRLLQEPVWRAYCNGKKSGFATRRDCGAKEWNILKAVEPISMGAGVLPATEPNAGAGDCELMYMRAKFERIVGSRDSEAFYMTNPDSNGAPELSIYLLRV